MQSLVIKRSVVVNGHKTSISLEDVFWNALKAIPVERQESLSETLQWIDERRTEANLSSALRVFVFEHYREKVLAA